MSWTKHGATSDTVTHAQSWAQILVIGYGNTLRRDDGAGIALAENLARHFDATGNYARLLTDTQLLPEMAAEVANRDIEAVVFVDTSATCDGDSSMQGCHIAIAEVSLDAASPSTGHQLDPATLLVYAALLYGHYPRAWIVTVPGQDFDHGEGFSPDVHELLATSAATANELLATIKEAVPCMN